MPWLRLDDRFDRHPKIAALRDSEFRVWIRVLLYCAMYRTAGEVPPSADVRGLSDGLRLTFRNRGLLDVIDDSDWVHDWDEFNPKDPTAAERQARFRNRHRDEAVTPAVTDSVTPAVTSTVTETAPRAQAGARGPSRPVLSSSKGSSRTEVHLNGLPFEKNLLVLRLMAWIGNDADAQTKAVISKAAEDLPPASLAKVLESALTKRPAQRARYAVGALRSERSEATR